MNRCLNPFNKVTELMYKMNNLYLVCKGINSIEQLSFLPLPQTLDRDRLIILYTKEVKVKDYPDAFLKMIGLNLILIFAGILVKPSLTLEINWFRSNMYTK